MADIDIVARGLASQALARVPCYTPEQYGAVGNGTTDDTAAINACVTAWLAGYKTIGSERYLGEIRFTKQYYIAGNTITVSQPNALIHGGSWLFTSPQAAIIGNADQYGVYFSAFNGSNSWRELLIKDMRLIGCGLRITGLNNTTFKMLFDHLIIKSTTGAPSNHGLLIDGLYETDFQFPYIEWGGTLYSCCYIQNSASAQTSSLFFWGANMHYGLHNIDATSAYNMDVYIFGGTFLEAQLSAIATTAYMHITGIHVENACRAGASAPGDASNLYGIELYGGGSILNCVGTSQASATTMKYMAVLYENCTYVGGFWFSDVVGNKPVYIDGTSSNPITLVGYPASNNYDVNTGNTNLIIDGFGSPAVMVTGGSAQAITTATTTTLTLGSILLNKTGATLATNQVTVPAGQYLIEAYYNGIAGSSSAATIGTTLQVYNNTGATVVASNQKTIVAPSGNNEPLHLEVKAVATLAVTTALSLRMVSTVSAGTLALTSDTGTPHYFKLTRIS